MEAVKVNQGALRVLAVVAAVIACLGAFTASASAKKCVANPEVSLIVDDSISMNQNDPKRIRVQALRMFLQKPAIQRMTVGAVEFGSTSGSLFAPDVVRNGRGRMLGSLRALNNDGYYGDAGTNYKAAFRASEQHQPGADARIFLTDGEPNPGDRIRVGRAKGVPTYVIGLNIGKPRSDWRGRYLNRIAKASGGRYYALKKRRGFGPRKQLSLLQPVVNQIAAKLACSKISKTVRVSAKRKGQRFGPYKVKFGRHQTVQVLATWAQPGTTIKFVSCRVVSRNGRVIADLKGKGKRSKLKVRIYTNKASKRIVVKRPRRGARLVFKVRVVKIKRRTPVVVQIEQGGGEDAFLPGSGGKPPTSKPTTPPPPRRIVITVDNRVTNGMGMREDPTPARLTTQRRILCSSRGCNINGTERRTGDTYDAAVCQAWGERTTNGHDASSADDANPHLFESSRYYGVRLTDGTFGYVSEVWIAAKDRGGLWLPLCP